jgi:hypothetical protein
VRLHFWMGNNYSARGTRGVALAPPKRGRRFFTGRQNIMSPRNRERHGPILAHALLLVALQGENATLRRFKLMDTSMIYPFPSVVVDVRATPDKMKMFRRVLRNYPIFFDLLSAGTV